ncbi:uncharacterized protein FIESC28_08908 [Fusarium coffeatum]|uniref:Uncharacterized protein n=1 Tax=Fusarium coffeatum TaxID=231269 RepID=A0A366R611_9HYPO|nr:uncharacterized protein FIESC28_08908 [Fusarium coffeatum]RBR11625.1 hypothetical protein FIESC28_08908 [Fusarium coffeatum]
MRDLLSMLNYNGWDTSQDAGHPAPLVEQKFEESRVQVGFLSQDHPLPAGRTRDGQYEDGTVGWAWRDRNNSGVGPRYVTLANGKSPRSIRADILVHFDTMEYDRIRIYNSCLAVFHVRCIIKKWANRGSTTYPRIDDEDRPRNFATARLAIPVSLESQLQLGASQDAHERMATIPIDDKVPKAPPRPTIYETGVQVETWKESTEAMAPKGKKRKANDDLSQTAKRLHQDDSGKSSATRTQAADTSNEAILTVSVTPKSGMVFSWKTSAGHIAGGVIKVELTEFSTLSETSRAQATDPGHKAILTVSVTANSGLTFKWRTETGNMNGGIDRVQLIEYPTASDARFAAIEAHDQFWRHAVAIQNKVYVISLARKRIKRFAATSGKKTKYLSSVSTCGQPKS